MEETKEERKSITAQRKSMGSKKPSFVAMMFGAGTGTASESPKHEGTTTAFPGMSIDMDASARESRNERIEERQIWQEMRDYTKPDHEQPERGCMACCCNVLDKLTPDCLGRNAVKLGKVGLLTTIQTVEILETVLGGNIGKETHKLLWNNENWEQYEFRADVENRPGFLSDREMIYCARLSLLAYLTNVTYDDFFPENRENELLGRVFNQNDGLEQIHQIFLVSYVSSLFDQTRLPDGSRSENFGRSKGLDVNLQTMNLELIQEFNVDHNQLFMAKSKALGEQGGDIVIAFQGTADSQDFKTNLNGISTPFEPLWDRTDAGKHACLQGRLLCCCLESAEQKDLKNLVGTNFGRVHLGFYNAFLMVKPLIQFELEKLLKGNLVDKQVRIIVTGHSLGGALACLCTAWLIQWFRFMVPGGLPEKFRVLSVTFGQPKVGDDDFVKAISNDVWTNRKQGEYEAKFKTYRIFTPLDPVPTVPPNAMGFKHCYAMCSIREGHLYFLPNNFSKFSDSTNDGIKRAIDKGLEILSFHDLFCYLDAVMHFADLSRKETQDLDSVFGTVDYQADTLKPDFLTKF